MINNYCWIVARTANNYCCVCETTVVCVARAANKYCYTKMCEVIIYVSVAITWLMKYKGNTLFRTIDFIIQAANNSDLLQISCWTE